MTGLDIHGQGDNKGIRQGSLEGSGTRRVDFYATHTMDSILKEPELIILIMVDLELPITEEVVRHKRTNGSDFQVQLDAIDAELTKFDNGKGEGVECGLG